jgi:hypothetical protein
MKKLKLIMAVIKNIIGRTQVLPLWESVFSRNARNLSDYLHFPAGTTL